MKTSKNLCYFLLAVIFSIFSYACERIDYELLERSSAGKWTLYTTADGLPGNQVRGIRLDSKDNLWFTFPGNGLAKFDNKTWTYYRAGTSALLNDGVICVDETADGKLIFGTSDGLSFLTPTTNIWSSFFDPLNSMFVNNIKVASNGWIWVGTRDQGYYLNKGAGFVKTVTSRYSTVNKIEETSQGNIYLGTDSGLIRWNGTSYSYITTANGLPDNKVTSMHYDRKERLWIGTDAGTSVSWIDKTGVHKLNLMTGSDSVEVRDIREDRNGDIWFATFRNGLIRYDGVVPHKISLNNGFPEDKILCIAEDKDGNLWFGLNSMGLVKYTLPINDK